MYFVKGAYYKHINNVDVSFRVLNTIIFKDKTALKIQWYNDHYNAPMNCTETLEIKKDQYEKWNRVYGRSG